MGEFGSCKTDCLQGHSACVWPRELLKSQDRGEEDLGSVEKRF